ncbi:hypothetical protein ACFFUA_02325 [Streptomyces heliomycini]|uniref:Uncharacterized protein n=1 Tax=Streptomyces heliomycini TaxID=284032 RepID=A0ABV5L4K1_9ACTN
MVMLLRRLARVVGALAEGRPLGSICPVATSATLGSGGGTEARERTAASGPDGTEGGPRAMLDVASQVFGARFPDDAVIGEERQPLEDLLTPLDLILPLSAPDEPATLPDPSRHEDGLHAIARATVGCNATDRRELGRRLLAHPLTHALLKTDPVRPLTTAEALAGFDATSPWRAAVVREAETTAATLARFVALISEARRSSAATSGAFARSWLGRSTRRCARTAYPPMRTRGQGSRERSVCATPATGRGADPA